MEMLVGDKWVEIDVGKMTIEIDDVFHREISSKSGVVIGHNLIVRFITTFVNESNRRELEVQHEMKIEDERLKMREDEIISKIESGKVVSDLDSIGNKVKYYVFGYVFDGEDFATRIIEDD